MQIGTSGWSYTHWYGPFFPKTVKAADMLPFYATKFSTVEINNTFYHLPSEKAVERWENIVPKDFIFSVKASRYITHLKRLKDCQESLPLFLERLKGLKKKLGPILFQLPPSFHCDLERLNEFIVLLPKKQRYVFEYRHPSWYIDEVYQILRQHDIALCITDLGGKQSPEVVTASFTYLRLHGPKKAYQGSYSQKALDKLSDQLKSWKQEGIDAFVYFDNDEKGFAPADAERLKDLL